jgi:S-layer family protein
MVEILGYGDLVSGSKSNFSDTQGHWADPWIAIAAGRNIVKGDGDGKFRPDAIVSYNEAITMAVRGLGYTDESNELASMTWPTNFKLKAADLGLTKDVKMLADGADRGGVAQLLYNALEAVLVTVNSDGDVVKSTVQIEEDDKVVTKYVKLLSKIATNENIDITPDSIDPDHKNFLGDKVDLEPYMFQNISAYLNDDDEVVYVDDVNVLTFTGTVTDIGEDFIEVENADEDEYTFILSGSAIDFLYNGEEADYADGLLLVDEAEVTVVLDAEDDDKLKDDIYEVEGIVAKQASGYVQVEDTYVKDELQLDVIYLPEDDDEVDFANLTVKGDATELADIEEDDVLTVYVPLDDDTDDYFDKEAASKMTIVVTRDVVEGKVSKINSDMEAYINGTYYELNGVTLTSGDEGVFYLDHAGKIFSFEEEGSSDPGNYALVLDVTNGYQSAAEDGVVLAEPKVKLLTASGEEITYVLDYEDLEDIVDDSAQTLVVDLEEGDLVEYDLNSDDEIDELTVDSDDTRTYNKIKTDVNSFNLASSVVIFNVPSNVTDDAEVITADDLDEKSVTGYKVVDSDEIVVLIVTDGAVGQSGIYAIITDDAGKAYDEDEEKEVRLYTAYVNGEEVEYFAHKDIESGIAAGDDIVKLTLSNGKLKEADVVTGSAVKAGVASNNRVSGSIKDTDGKVYFLASDVVVYVIEADGDVKVGAKSDIRNSEFKVYDTVDNDLDYDIVVVFED